MARLNVEDEIESDVRFHALTRMLGGDAQKALGMCFQFWRVAQHFWGDEKRLVPENHFKLGGFDLLLDVDLAERRAGGIYCRGAEERFDWYLQKCRASRKGVAAKKARKEAAEPAPEPEEAPRLTTEWSPVDREEDSGQPEEVPRLTGARAPVNPPTPVLTPDKKTNTPLSPPARSRELTRLAENAAAHATTTALICLNAYWKGAPDLGQAAAEKALGPRTWALVMTGFDSWENFATEFNRKRQKNHDGFFKRDLVTTFRALLPEVLAKLEPGERGGTGPPMSPSEEGLS